MYSPGFAMQFLPDLATLDAAAALAGLLKEKDAMAGLTVGVVLSGGNIDRSLYASVISEA